MVSPRFLKIFWTEYLCTSLLDDPKIQCCFFLRCTKGSFRIKKIQILIFKTFSSSHCTYNTCPLYIQIACFLVYWITFLKWIAWEFVVKWVSKASSLEFHSIFAHASSYSSCPVVVVVVGGSIKLIFTWPIVIGCH